MELRGKDTKDFVTCNGKMQKISPIKERILKFADTLDISKREFYKKTGISRGTLESSTGITEETLAKFIATFKELSLEWILTGEGPMLRSDLPAAHPATEPGAGIPLIPINAMAGVFTGEQSVLELECERYVVPAFKDAEFLITECERYVVPAFKDAEFLITVKGSSMIPKYYSGDIVACKRMPLDTFFQWNKVYVLDTEQGPLIKRVKKGATDETLSIFSDNPDYEPFELPRTKIYHIALVVGVIRLE